MRSHATLRRPFRKAAAVLAGTTLLLGGVAAAPAVSQGAVDDGHYSAWDSLIEVVPEAPVLDGDVVRIPSPPYSGDHNGFAYRVQTTVDGEYQGVEWFYEATKLTLEPGSQVFIQTSAPNPGFVFPEDVPDESGAYTWHFYHPDFFDLLTVSPEAPTRSGDTLIIPAVHPISTTNEEEAAHRIGETPYSYDWGEGLSTAGARLTLDEGTDEITVRAVPHEGFELAEGAQAEWTFRYGDTVIGDQHILLVEVLDSEGFSPDYLPFAYGYLADGEFNALGVGNYWDSAGQAAAVLRFDDKPAGAEWAIEALATCGEDRDRLLVGDGGTSDGEPQLVTLTLSCAEEDLTYPGVGGGDAPFIYQETVFEVSVVDAEGAPVPGLNLGVQEGGLTYVAAGIIIAEGETGQTGVATLTGIRRLGVFSGGEIAPTEDCPEDMPEAFGSGLCYWGVGDGFYLRILLAEEFDLQHTVFQYNRSVGSYSIVDLVDSICGSGYENAEGVFDEDAQGSDDVFAVFITLPCTLADLGIESDDEADPIEPALALSTTSVFPGDEIVIEGSGYVAGEFIEVALGSLLGTSEADGDGTFTASVTVPEATEPGEYTLTVTGDSGGAASANITVLAEAEGDDDDDQVTDGGEQADSGDRPTDGGGQTSDGGATVGGDDQMTDDVQIAAGQSSEEGPGVTAPSVSDEDEAEESQFSDGPTAEQETKEDAGLAVTGVHTAGYALAALLLLLAGAGAVRSAKRSTASQH
ncbi:hypothetical protein [Nesterenkonia muleiensis]|uniref:hypothetical protein n=1 Tax=Nesterenkonia muleiensis TaxID=2282648 RepID=UPI000E70B59F|nr:hypothetical protein [Nesterenkonia muleiensis]